MENYTLQFAIQLRLRRCALSIIGTWLQLVVRRLESFVGLIVPYESLIIACLKL